ncbi:ATP-binding cassette domain-containing protein [Bradyrhizobium sp. CNPSo 4010]|uniref:ATP-binding cassette domain-containing protein n=1 Tax=Bradyrhizobium agreste TaxID=2751811 RepID=A0ABS0PJ56_9BRAD|nr:ATP-binding cassette domain-containing protein [Bradyrhizobium agreste]MBH5397233.1 ATP-binding cassette domain-containing protein [Bradyrhizobium agreste]
MTGGYFEIQNISGGYGSGRVVRDVSISIARGEVVCLLGRNGVGKSTLAKLACGFLRPMSGAVQLAGVEITGKRPSENLTLGLTYCPQERVVFDDLTVAENLSLMRTDRRLDEFEPYFRAFPRLSERRGQYAGTLSGGEKKLLSFVRGLSEGSAMMVIDEPTEGVQFENVVRMAELMLAQKEAGASFLVVEQNLTLVDRVADRIVIMDHGEVALSAAASELDRQQILAHLTV